MERSFADLQEILNSPEFEKTTFFDPALDSAIKGYERIAGFCVPKALREFWLIADGQPNDATPIFQADDFIILPVEAALEAWQLQKEFYSNPDYCSTESLETSEEVKVSAWEPGWLPFGWFWNGDTLCVDLVPTELGTTGQVIITTVNGVHMRIANSFEEWFWEQINHLGLD